MPAATTMNQLEYLRKHIDALVALSHNVKDRAVSEKLREMADECRIMLSLADVSEIAARLKDAVAAPRDEQRNCPLPSPSFHNRWPSGPSGKP
jgi:hypothetical protein